MFLVSMCVCIAALPTHSLGARLDAVSAQMESMSSVISTVSKQLNLMKKNTSTKDRKTFKL